LLKPIDNVLDRLIAPTLTNEAELARFVRRVTAGCIAAAIAVGTVVVALLFGDMEMAARAVPISATVSAVVAYPVIRVLGKAQLELYRAMTSIAELTLRDPLTGVGNRRALLDRVAEIEDEEYVLVVADIDRFKSINDLHGHLAGDVVIAATARMMQDELGTFGPVCRTGGEEFALLATGADPAMLRRRLAAFAQRVSSEPVVVGDSSIAFTVSIGAALGRPGQPFAEVYAAADRALYVAKTSGRDMMVFDFELERRLDPPLPPDEIAWISDAEDDLVAVERDRRPDAA
jgi:diguanylate cyclase (GGDEF)-like protein